MAQFQAKGDILPDGAVFEQGKVLKDKTDLSFLDTSPGRLFAVDEDAALVRFIQAGDHA